MKFPSRQYIVFWWNMPNPHTLPLFLALSQSGRFDVRVVYEEHLSEERKQSGWKGETSGLETEFLDKKNWKKQIEGIVSETQDSVYIFSGVGVYPKLRYALKISLQKKIPCYASSERSVSSNHSTYLFQYFHNLYRRLSLGKGLKGLFSISRMGKSYFARVGYRKDQLFDWMYFVENSHLAIPAKPHDPIRIVYIGQMIPRKGVDTLLLALGGVKAEFSLDLYGTGPQREEYQELGNYLFKEKEVNWHGVVSNKEIVQHLPQYDILVLPSQGRGDGWGGVVNEGINAGCAVICSDRCGAKDLVQYGKVGEIFEAGQAGSLTKAIERLLDKTYLIQCQRNAIAYQAKIDPANAVEYFERIITGGKPTAPWLC